jgi:hypothetical protein
MIQILIMERGHANEEIQWYGSDGFGTGSDHHDVIHCIFLAILQTKVDFVLDI